MVTRIDTVDYLNAVDVGRRFIGITIPGSISVQNDVKPQRNTGMFHGE